MNANETEPVKRSSLKRALLAIDQLQVRLEELERRRKEPVAVIGMGCRFPGNADDPESYWQLLCDGRDTLTEIPADRWDVDAFYDPQPGRPGKMYTRYGSFLENVDRFDAAFFGISPREAALMDPQQRLVLEVGWEALEHAGIAADRLSGSRSGVFIGAMTDDYLRLCLNARDPQLLGAHFVTGNSLSFTAGRLSYFLGLHGPSLTVDTACSSSLTAVHLACSSLRSGECDLALAGGVNLILSPELFISLSQNRAISADGRCKTFDESADGFGRGEGCGILVLKRLSDALTAGDPIWAVIRGSAITHDGPSGGLTVPNGKAQQAMLRGALADACLSPAAVQYVEAHGTGTPLGDPIEVEALGAVLCEGRSPEQPLVVGSVKTLIGHLDSAAGAAGLIKVVLCLHHGRIPPIRNFRKANPHLPLERFPIRIATGEMEWPRGAVPRVAGVSGFGLGGTNVHVVVGEAPAAPPERPKPERTYHILALSAKTEPALSELAARTVGCLQSHPEPSLAAVCHAANNGRAHFDHRAAVVVKTVAETAARLEEIARGRGRGGCRGCGPMMHQPPRIGFLFSGVAAPAAGLGRRLYEEPGAFRDAMEACERLVRHRLHEPLAAALFAPGDPADRPQDPRWQDAALFAMAYALASLWGDWGIGPCALMGVGPGEYAAACWAGVFGLEDAMRLAIGDDPDPVSYSPPNLAVISSLSGEVARPGEMSCAAYWRDVRKRSGRAREGLQALQRIGIDVFVEVGPAPAILESASDGWPSGVLGLASLRPGRDEWQQMLESLAALYTRGVAVNWSGLGPGETSGRVRLPTYPFQRERHWIRAADLGKPLAGEASGGRWEYEICWESAEAEEIAPAAAEESRAWLVFSDRQGCGDRLVELVRGGGEACLCVERGPRYGERSRERFEIAPSAPQDYRRLMDRWMKRAAASRRTIVFLWALDGEAAECPTGEAWIQEQQGFCGSALLLVQALAARRRGKEPLPSLVFVTRGAQSVQKGETPPGWGASTLWGLARVVALEHPEIPCLRIDLDARRPENEMAMLAREIRQRSRETEVAFRGPRRFVPRLARSQEERPTVVSELFQPSDGAYVVSGGFHGLGLKVVEWLLDRGARHVAVLSRSADSLSARSLCRRIGRPGVNLMALPVDVSRYGDLAEALRRVRDAAPGIRGVVHCAGVLDDGALFQQSWPRFERVLAPKVAGSWNLHLLTRNDPLDFFILFSSTAAVIGAMGQGNYAAANAFMDGLAHYRVGEGVPALSINWGPWSEVGMAAAISSAEQLRMLDRGLESIPPRRGIEILERLIRQHRPQACILPIDWERFAGHYPSLGRSPFLSRVCSAGEGSGKPDAGRAETGPPRTGAPPAIFVDSMPDSAAVESRILHYVQNIMQLPKGGIELHVPLNQMGLDSIMALELANRIAAELQVEIPVADLLDGITVADLLERVQLRSAAADPLPAGRPAAPEDVFSGQVDQLSDEEVERFLTMMLPQEKSTP